MAHFARIENGQVAEVIVVNNDVLDDNGSESEAKGIAFCKSLFGKDTQWVQTSYNATMRGKYAGVGDQWTGAEFAAPTRVAVDQLVAEAYQRGKSDAIADALTAQTDRIQ